MAYQAGGYAQRRATSSVRGNKGLLSQYISSKVMSNRRREPGNDVSITVKDNGLGSRSWALRSNQMPKSTTLKLLRNVPLSAANTSKLSGMVNMVDSSAIAPFANSISSGSGTIIMHNPSGGGNDLGEIQEEDEPSTAEIKQGNTKLFALRKASSAAPDGQTSNPTVGPG